MAKNTFLDWDQTASNNTDVGGIGIQGANAVSNFDDALRTVMAQLRAGVDGEVAYITKSANYTAVANDNNGFLRCSAAMTLSLTAAATLGANWHIKVVADGGDVIVDPNAAELIDGAATITIKNGYTADIVCNGSAFFSDKMQATVSSAINTLSSLGPPGYVFGLTTTTNGGSPTTNIDISSGFASSSASPYYLMQLASSITKNTNSSWAVGNNNGSLDTGVIANSTYFGYLIQRQDTGVVDVLTSLSSTSPTMPSNYTIRTPALFAFARSAGVNGLPTPLFPFNESVKAFVNFNGTGTVAIRSSKNVISITDNAVGDYTVNFAVPFADAGYGFSLSSNIAGPSYQNPSFAPTTSSFRIVTTNSSGAGADASYVSATFVR